MAPVRDGNATGTVPKTRPHDNGQLGEQRPRREPFINNTPNNLDQVGDTNKENGHKSGVRRSRKTSNAEIASTQLGTAGLPSSDSRLQLSKENVSRNAALPELGVRMERSGSSASSSVRGEPRRSAKAQNMDERDEGASAKNINVAKIPNREEVQSRLEHLQAYIVQTTKLTEDLHDKPEARNKLVGLVAELKDSENKLRSIIRGFDAVDATNEAFNRELKEDDQKMKSVQAYAQILDSQRAALETAASGSFHNQLRQLPPTSNESMDSAVKIASQLGNIQDRIQNLHELQGNRSELAYLLGERDEQLSNEFQMVQNKLRDLHLKKALMNKFIEHVENSMPAAESNHNETPDTIQGDADNDEESDSSNDESLGDSEGQHVYTETTTSQSRQEFMEEINAKLDEAERHFLKFQIQGTVNPLSVSQHPAEEREVSYDLLETLNRRTQPLQRPLEAQQAQDMLTYMSEAREEASASRGSSVKRDNNSRVSSFGKNSSKTPKKVNEERFSNAQLADLQSIISQVAEQYSQGLPLNNEFLKTLINQRDLKVADNEIQARVMSPRDSRSQSRDSLASQCIDELQAYVSESDKRVRSSHANSSSSLDDNSACVQHNLACEHSRDLVNISQEDSSSTDEAASSSFGELSYEKKKSNAVAPSSFERPSIKELQDMTFSLHQQTLGMRQHAATIANAAKEIQLLKSKLPLRDKKTNPQAVSQQMLSELQARKGEFEGLMSKHKGCSSSANQDVSDNLQAVGSHSVRGDITPTASSSRINQPMIMAHEGNHSLNDSRSYSVVNSESQDRPGQLAHYQMTAPLNNSASNLTQMHIFPRCPHVVDPQQVPMGFSGAIQLGHSAQPHMSHNFGPGGPSVDQASGLEHGLCPRHEQAFMDAGPRMSIGRLYNRQDGSGEHDYVPPSMQQMDLMLSQLTDVVRSQQTDISMLKASVTQLMNHQGQMNTQPGHSSYQLSSELHVPPAMTPVLRYHESSPADVHNFHQRGFAPEAPLAFQEEKEPSGWLAPGMPQPLMQESQWGFVRESGVTEALNNQVLPGCRANNYHDNFRSHSRQNLLSTSIQGQATKIRADEPSSSRTYQNMGVVREEPQADKIMRYSMPVPVTQYDFPPPPPRHHDRGPIDYSANTGRQTLSSAHFPMTLPEGNMVASSGTQPQGPWYHVEEPNGNGGGRHPSVAGQSANIPLPSASGGGAIRKQTLKTVSMGRPSVTPRQGMGANHQNLQFLGCQSSPIPLLPSRRLSDPRLQPRKVKRTARRKPSPSGCSGSLTGNPALDGLSYQAAVTEHCQIMRDVSQSQGMSGGSSGNNRVLFDSRRTPPIHPWSLHPILNGANSDRELDHVPTRLDAAEPDDL